MADLNELIDKTADLIVHARRTVVFTGAGVSTESGIPDFRSPGGIWSRFDPEDFTYQKFISDRAARRKHWQLLREGFLGAAAQPNPAHYAIAELDRLGKLDCIITQNVDNLHQKAGVPANKVFELHGNMQFAICLDCRRRYPIAELKARIDRGEEMPDCEVCRGILKPDAVFFGEALPEEVLRDATHHAYSCDLFIVIGSTLVVFPAAYVPQYALESGAKLVIINLSPTPMDRQAAVLISAKAGEVMPEVAHRVAEKMGAES
ncbi:MAG: Sir2 family NAD-dependent protein deacetylase [Chloroflexi bacterium]|nr:Sir2 family NAD-dependent protein deacetylase [Chloroflexota bacterium]